MMSYDPHVNQDVFFISNSELRNERLIRTFGKVHHYSNTKILLFVGSDVLLRMIFYRHRYRTAHFN